MIVNTTGEVVGGGGGEFTPSLLALYSTSEAQTDLTVEADMSGYTWLIIEFEKPNEMMSGYSGPFRKIVWIPTDSMGDGETGTTSDHTGVAYNQAIPTSLSVSDCSMISIKDAHTIHWVASGNYKVRRVWGI